WRSICGHGGRSLGQFAVPRAGPPPRHAPRPKLPASGLAVRRRGRRPAVPAVRLARSTNVQPAPLAELACHDCTSERRLKRRVPCGTHRICPRILPGPTWRCKRFHPPPPLRSTPRRCDAQITDTTLFTRVCPAAAGRLAG